MMDIKETSMDYKFFDKISGASGSGLKSVIKQNENLAEELH